MTPSARKKLILNILYENGEVSIDKLALTTNVSQMTIRRDLVILESKKKIIRTHGGAILNEFLVKESSFQDKENKYVFEKRQIALEATKYINDYSKIILDSGTTTLEIAKLIKNREKITVVTNDIKIASELMDGKVKVIVAGGELQNNIGALFGPLAESTIKEMNVDVLFLGAHAIQLDKGVTAPAHQKSSIKKKMIKASEKVWLVADTSKFNQKSFAKVCDLTEIDGVITDNRLTKENKLKLQEYLQVVTAKGREN